MTRNRKAVTRELDWYADKLARGEPFTSLLYGDGEFLVASGTRVGAVMQCGEVVTRTLCDEMLACLRRAPEPGVLYGTDPHLLDPDSYGGRDKEVVYGVARRADAVLNRCPEREWVDGVVWDRAVRAGELGPLFRTLKTRRVCVVGHPGLEGLRALNASRFVAVPADNACGHLDDTTARAEATTSPGSGPTVFVVCCGLGAIPLIHRLRDRLGVRHTYLDLGSTFDVFAGLGPERGWRRELYADPAAHAELIRKNLEGS